MKKRNIIILSVSLLVLLLLALCVALPAILHRNSDDVSIDEEFNIVNDKILTFEADFISENGQLTIETSTTMLTELCTELEELKETGKIKDYYYNPDLDTCIFAELPSGQGYIYAPSIEGFMGTPGNVEVVTIEPYRDDVAFYLRSDLLAYGKKPEIAAKVLDDEFERVDYTLKYTPDNIIDSFDNIPKNSIVLWMGHGGFNEKIGSVLFLNVPGDNEESFIKHYENLSDGAFATSKEDVLGITSKFIYSMEDDAFENCIVYLGSCNSMTDAYGIPNNDEEITNSSGEKKETISLYDSFLSKGAIAVAGNTQAVNIAYNFSMMHDFCYGLTQKHDNRYYTLNDAIEYAKEKNGVTDPWIFTYDSEMVVLCNDLSIGDKTLEEIYFPEEPDNTETNIEVTSDIVIDAVNYSREIISVFEWMDYSGYNHTIRIPKINLSSENAQNFNNKIYNDHAAPYEVLLNYHEEQMIYHVNYTYKLYEDVVGIIVEFTGGPQAAGAEIRRSYYYYDVKNDKEISLDEYINALGYTTNELESILKKMEDISGYEAHSNLGDNPKLEACIADTESTLVVFTNAAYTMDGTTSYEVQPIVPIKAEIVDTNKQTNISENTEISSEISSENTIFSLKFELLPNGTYSVVGIEGGEDTHIVIPKMYEGITVSAIGDNAFQNWSSLLSVEIPDSIVSIGAHAFEDCNALTDIQIPSNIEFVGEDAFSGSWKLPFAEDITNEYKAYYLGNDENPYLILIEFDHMSSSNRSYSYNVKYGTRVICGDMMMWGYKLANITLPETLVAINDSVFANCISLKEIIIPDSVKHIGSSAFHDLEAITEISIPDGINTIKSGLCALCYSLRSVKIPNSVTTIESGAFYFCPKLNSIEFSGTVDEWNSISKADGWDSECGNYTVYCTDGRI